MPCTEQIRVLDLDGLRRLARLMLFPTPPGADADFLRLALPVLANDIRLVGSFRRADAAVLDIPITAVHGLADDRVSEGEMRDWRRCTSVGFDFHAVGGDHFFLHPDQRRDEVLAILREVVK
jgi:surfactin synthase thioesterase subunit